VLRDKNCLCAFSCALHRKELQVYFSQSNSLAYTANIFILGSKPFGIKRQLILLVELVFEKILMYSFSVQGQKCFIKVQ
jgi:hypothetical protein